MISCFIKGFEKCCMDKDDKRLTYYAKTLRSNVLHHDGACNIIDAEKLSKYFEMGVIVYDYNQQVLFNNKANYNRSCELVFHMDHCYLLLENSQN